MLTRSTPDANNPPIMQSEVDETVRITFSEQCPVTKTRHTFTCTHFTLLSGKRLEAIASKIRHSTTTELGLCESRSRALMETIFKVIAWERGLLPDHPLLPEVGPRPETRKRAASPLEGEKKRPEDNFVDLRSSRG